MFHLNLKPFVFRFLFFFFLSMGYFIIASFRWNNSWSGSRYLIIESLFLEVLLGFVVVVAFFYYYYSLFDLQLFGRFGWYGRSFRLSPKFMYASKFGFRATRFLFLETRFTKAFGHHFRVFFDMLRTLFC